MRIVFKFLASIFDDVWPVVSTLFGIILGFIATVLVLGVLDIHVLHIVTYTDAADKLNRSSCIQERLAMYMASGITQMMVIILILFCIGLVVWLFAIGCYLKRQWVLAAQEDEAEAEEQYEDTITNQTTNHTESKDNY